MTLNTEIPSTNSTHCLPHDIWMEMGKYTHKTILRYLLDSGLDIEDGKSSDPGLDHSMLHYCQGALETGDIAEELI